MRLDGVVGDPRLDRRRRLRRRLAGLDQLPASGRCSSRRSGHPRADLALERALPVISHSFTGVGALTHAEAPAGKATKTRRSRGARGPFVPCDRRRERRDGAWARDGAAAEYIHPTGTLASAAATAPLYDCARERPTALIMAAGEGTRMRSSCPRSCTRSAAGRWSPGRSSRRARRARDGSRDRLPGPDLPRRFRMEWRPLFSRRRTAPGRPPRRTRGRLPTPETVLVLSGDHPLISAGVIQQLVAAHNAQGAAATVLTTELDDPGRAMAGWSSAGRDVRPHRGAKDRGTRPTPSSRSARSTNTYAFLGDLAGKGPCGLTNDNPRVSTTSPTSSRSSAGTAGRPCPQGRGPFREPRGQ